MLKCVKSVIEFVAKLVMLFTGLSIMAFMALVIGFKKGLNWKYEIKYGDEYDMREFENLYNIFYPRIKKFNKVQNDYVCHLKDRPMFQMFAVKNYKLGLFGERDGISLFQQEPELTFFIGNVIRITNKIKAWTRLVFIINIAHELKHAHQYELNHDFSKDYVDLDKDFEGYRAQKIEREARKAARFYVISDLIFIMKNIF